MQQGFFEFTKEECDEIVNTMKLMRSGLMMTKTLLFIRMH
jgi:hypothetical protein